MELCEPLSECHKLRAYPSTHTRAKRGANLVSDLLSLMTSEEVRPGVYIVRLGRKLMAAAVSPMPVSTQSVHRAPTLLILTIIISDRQDERTAGVDFECVIVIDADVAFGAATRAPARSAVIDGACDHYGSHVSTPVSSSLAVHSSGMHHNRCQMSNRALRHA